MKKQRPFRSSRVCCRLLVATLMGVTIGQVSKSTGHHSPYDLAIRPTAVSGGG